MFITIQSEYIRPSKKEMNKAITIFKLPDNLSYAMNYYVPLTLPKGSLPSTCMLCTPSALH
jgi:hypothetical protein